MLWFESKLHGDEFDKSLEMDLEKMMKMDPVQKQKYLDRLAEKRRIAHELDMRRNN